MHIKNIILASASPRRYELLSLMGIHGFRVMAPEIDEVMDETISPEETVRRLSREKAVAVTRHARPDDIIIAADTIVCYEDVRLGKPKDKFEAFKMLNLLSGNRHEVYTGVTVLRNADIVTEVEMTEVYFREMKEHEIAAYIATGEPMDKAGAYAIQGLGAIFVNRIEGDYYNVMGLPISRLSTLLERFGVNLFQS